MPDRALKRRAREARSWLFDACFPLWFDEGVTDWGFVERLDLNHRAQPTETTRVRVQARQIYVFCEAARLGWQPEASSTLAMRVLETLLGAARRSDGLVGRTLSVAKAELVDDTPDLYDAAFVLFAIGEAAKQTDDKTPLAEAARSAIAALDANMTHSSGGFAESWPAPQTRQQNPHMHLYEAWLSLAQGLANTAFLDRARDIRSLALTRFMAADLPVLFETFAADWSPLPDVERASVEPGHLFEWSTLLRRHAELERAEPPAAAAALHAFATSASQQDGYVVSAINRNGEIIDGARRVWAQAEALRAHLSSAAYGDRAAIGHAVDAFDVIMDEHLTPEGAWVDAYSADGAPAVDFVPASAGYHIVGAFARLIDQCDA